MTATSYLDGKVILHAGDCREVLASLPDASVDAIVTDPPYALTSASRNGSPRTNDPETPFGRTKLGDRGFMGKTWDTGETAFAAEFWAQVLRVLKPGGHCAAFSGTRTYHRMACAIEDAGFEIRDQLMWVHGNGFPKGLDVSKAIDKAAGAEREVVGADPHFALRNKTTSKFSIVYGHMNDVASCPITAPSTDAAKQWAGFGTGLKPAWEPICLARKSLIGTVAANVLMHGVGALNIDKCRVEAADGVPKFVARSALLRRRENHGNCYGDGLHGSKQTGAIDTQTGRWPANLLLSDSEDVRACFPDAPGQQRAVGPQCGPKGSINRYGDVGPRDQFEPRGDSNSAARFFATFPEPEQRLFYTAKAGAEDRLGSKHPTVKPIELMQWLCRLICPPCGTVLDPFAGTGTTGEAAWREGMRAILIEREPEYQADIARRMDLATQPTKRSAVAKSKNKLDRPEDLPLFGGRRRKEAGDSA